MTLSPLVVMQLKCSSLGHYAPCNALHLTRCPPCRRKARVLHLRDRVPFRPQQIGKTCEQVQP